MDNNRNYEMRKKLLDIQNELLKGVGEEKEASPETGTPSYTMHSSTPANDRNTTQGDPLIELLKDIRTNQQTMIHLLNEINGRLGR